PTAKRVRLRQFLCQQLHDRGAGTPGNLTSRYDSNKQALELYREISRSCLLDTRMASLTEQIKKVQERIKEAEDRVQFLKALPVRNEYESVCLVETEKRLIIFRREEAILSKEGAVGGRQVVPALRSA
ncbi:hypothetical protein HaLaN_00714, partial [Haematococcus lacustris]